MGCHSPQASAGVLREHVLRTQDASECGGVYVRGVKHLITLLVSGIGFASCNEAGPECPAVLTTQESLAWKNDTLGCDGFRSAFMQRPTARQWAESLRGIDRKCLEEKLGGGGLSTGFEITYQYPVTCEGASTSMLMVTVGNNGLVADVTLAVP